MTWLSRNVILYCHSFHWKGTTPVKIICSGFNFGVFCCIFVWKVGIKVIERNHWHPHIKADPSCIVFGWLAVIDMISQLL